MINSRTRNILILISLLFFNSVIFAQQETNSQQAAINPDYANITIPQNIAPLNFTITPHADSYHVKIHSKLADPIEIKTSDNRIQIPPKKWHTLLTKNPNSDLYIDITLTQNSKQVKLPTITNKIVPDNIDKYLFYRRHHPTHYLYNGKVGVYQYDLENNKEKPILDSYNFEVGGCVNCHTFSNHTSNPMTLAVRSRNYGSSMLIIKDGIAEKIATKITYTAWHPNSKILTFSANKVSQFFHSANNEVRDAVDMDSMIACYFVESKKIVSPEAFSAKDVLETYPFWSPDGKYLYYCIAPLTWRKDEIAPPPGFKSIKYDLVRIPYDVKTDKWGKVETIVSAKQTSKSNLLPRISPDGRWLLYCQVNYGCFPAFRKSSDLYLIDLKQSKENGKYQTKPLPINSDQSDAYHSFSSTSRWLVFSSKRGKGPFTRPYISHIDKDGNFSKPFVLPQKNPEFLDTCLDTYTVPEFAIEPVNIKVNELTKVIKSPESLNVQIPVTMASPKTAASSKEYLQVQE